MDDCVFCKIIKKEIPAEIEKETENLLIFKDNKPKAPIHLLFVPKTHYRDITEADGKIWEEVRATALEIAKEKNLRGFRLVHNAGEVALVPHMHVHFLADITSDREI
jgi:histidine triad (HIT) family protein